MRHDDRNFRVWSARASWASSFVTPSPRVLEAGRPAPGWGSSICRRRIMRVFACDNDDAGGETVDRWQAAQRTHRINKVVVAAAVCPSVCMAYKVHATGRRIHTQKTQPKRFDALFRINKCLWDTENRRDRVPSSQSFAIALMARTQVACR